MGSVVFKAQRPIYKVLILIVRLLSRCHFHHYVCCYKVGGYFFKFIHFNNFKSISVLIYHWLISVFQFLKLQINSPEILVFAAVTEEKSQLSGPVCNESCCCHLAPGPEILAGCDVTWKMDFELTHLIDKKWAAKYFCSSSKWSNVNVMRKRELLNAHDRI